MSGTVLRDVGNSWSGEHLEDWAPGGGSLRVYGTNGHGDVTWAAAWTGSVSGTARYDPFGSASAPTGSMPDFGFQGSWADDATRLSWAVTRWYAPAQGEFVSEDSLLGEPREPGSRHLYAFGGGEPVGRWDPDGRVERTVYLYYYQVGPHEWSYDTGWQSDWLQTAAGFRWAEAEIRWAGTLYWNPNYCYAYPLWSQSSLYINMLHEGSLTNESSIRVRFWSDDWLRVMPIEGEDHHGEVSICRYGCAGGRYGVPSRWRLVVGATLIAAAYFTLEGYERTQVPISNIYHVVFRPERRGGA